MIPRRLHTEDDLEALLAPIQRCFAGMEGRIDPPSSVRRLDVAAVRAQIQTGEVWAIFDTRLPVASVFLTPEVGLLSLGKLAVDPGYRRRGLARVQVDTAVARAQALGLVQIGLQTRVELTENHATFAALGFAETGLYTHPGYDHPTSVVMRRPVDAVRK